MGAELLQLPGDLYYWREKQKEVDFVYKYQGLLYAVEVKSGRRKLSQGLNTFLEKFPKAHPVIISPENFAEFSANPRKFLDSIAIK